MSYSSKTVSGTALLPLKPLCLNMAIMLTRVVTLRPSAIMSAKMSASIALTDALALVP